MANKFEYMTPYPAPQRKGDPLEAQAKKEQPNYFQNMMRGAGIKAPTSPPPQHLSLESAIKEDEHRRAQEALRWQGLNPREQIMEYAGMAGDLADLPMGASKALIHGNPQMIKTLSEAAERIVKRAPESEIAQFMKKLLDPENLRATVKGFKDIPELWTKRAAAAPAGKKRITHGLFGPEPATDRPAIYLDLKRSGDPLKRTAEHELTHRWWSEAPQRAKAAWQKTIDELGKHPQVEEGLSKSRTASESLSRTMEDLMADKTNKHVLDLKMMLGID